MRKSINGLIMLVVETLEMNPKSEHFFIFTNKAKKLVKILLWDKNGFALYYKRLERGKFKIPPPNENGHIELDGQQLSWLLAGLDFMTMAQFPEMNFAHYG